MSEFGRILLRKSFYGKLVAQSPNDEPASVLLERVREERARLEAAGRGRGRGRGRPRGSGGRVAGQGGGTGRRGRPRKTQTRKVIEEWVSA